MAISIVME